MAPFFHQQQYTLYLHLDVLGAFHVREELDKRARKISLTVHWAKISVSLFNNIRIICIISAISTVILVCK